MNYPVYQERHYGKKAEFLAKVREFGTPGAIGALETLDAALLLLAWGRQAPQALVLFHQTIELAMKAFLEEIHVLLVLQEINFDLAKALAKDRLQKHRLGSKLENFIDPENYDPQKTCLFDDAYRRVSQLITFESLDEKKAKRINKCRNAIAHYGGKEGEKANYLDLILNVAVPWLDEFYRKAYEVELADYVFAPHLRELVVAGEYMRLSKADTTLPLSHVLKPYAHRFLEGFVIGESNLLFDNEGDMRDVSEWEQENFKARLEQMDSQWSKHGVIGEKQGIPCVICGKPCVVAIGERLEIEGEPAYVPVAISCPGCGLHLEPAQKELVRLHYGPITRERFGEKIWCEEIDVFGES